MAEALANAYQSGRGRFYSAGIIAKGVDPNACRVMREIGIDISHQYSKTLDELSDIDFDQVITLCGHANDTCPIFPGSVKKMHVGFEDPPELAIGKTNEETLEIYRKVRDEIKAFVISMDEVLK